MRYSRLLLGIFLILFAGWIIVGEQMTGASADAVVNARLSTLRAPVAGRVEMPERELGTAVQEGEDLGSLTDTRVDRVRLDDLTMELAFEKARVLQLQTRIDKIGDAIPPLQERTARFRSDRIAELELQLALDAFEPPQGEQEVQVEAAFAQDRRSILEIELRAAQAGVFLGDGFNDAPWSEQRQAELVTLQDAAIAEHAEAEARQSALEARIGSELLATNTLTTASLTSTVNGQLWEILAAEGETVQRGQDVLRLLDCDSAIVTLSVSKSIYNRLRAGQNATFRMGSSGNSYPGTVTRLAGSGAATIYQNLAIAPSAQHLQRYDVALLVPALRDLPELRCTTGQTGRVYFETRPMDWLRRIWK